MAGKRTRRDADSNGFPDPAVDYRRRPELYEIGRGERGVLTVEPYKSEILPHWRFKTAAEAKRSAAAILKLFRRYRRARDFVGMDMARKFLQMGYTRSRRYARHKSGRKYAADGSELPEQFDEEKQRSAEIFKEALEAVKGDGVYGEMKRGWGSLTNSARSSDCIRNRCRHSAGASMPAYAGC
jgi:hypothetical protein